MTSMARWERGQAECATEFEYCLVAAQKKLNMTRKCTAHLLLLVYADELALVLPSRRLF